MSELVKKSKETPKFPNFEHILLIYLCKKVLISTKIYAVLYYTTLNPSIKFHYNQFIAFLSNVAHTQTDKQTNTSEFENITSFAKEVTNATKP